MARRRVAARLTAHWLLVALLAVMGLVAPASAGLEKSSSYRREDQITAVNSNVQYRYDGFGQRVQKQVDADTTHYLWNGDEVLKEYTGTGALKADYFLGAGREGIKTDSGWNWYLTDALDSTVLLTDDAGTVTAAYDYEPYGKTTQTAGNPGLYNPYRWTGQQFDSEAGMYYLRARHYHPKLGRFLARDPIGYAGGSNLYAYCGNDPLNCSDPSGLDETKTSVTVLQVKSQGRVYLGTRTNYQGTPGNAAWHYVNVQAQGLKDGNLAGQVPVFRLPDDRQTGVESFFFSRPAEVRDANFYIKNSSLLDAQGRSTVNNIRFTVRTTTETVSGQAFREVPGREHIILQYKVDQEGFLNPVKPIYVYPPSDQDPPGYNTPRPINRTDR